MALSDKNKKYIKEVLLTGWDVVTVENKSSEQVY